MTSHPFEPSDIKPKSDDVVDLTADRPQTSSHLHPVNDPFKRILLVEDDRTNQVMARGILKRLGHARVDLANDGLEALEALAAIDYDLVIMDCNLPGMDGFEAAHRIRRGEAGVLSPQIPIIAMTAFDTQADRARCLEAGMDGYLAKPVQPAKLAQTLTSLSSADTQNDQGAAPQKDLASEPQPEPIFVEAELFDRMMQDWTFARDMIPCILRDLRTRTDELAAGMSRGDLEQVGDKAHSIKGLAGNLSAHAVVALAARIEAHARTRTIDAEKTLIPDLRTSLTQLEKALEQWLAR